MRPCVALVPVAVARAGCRLLSRRQRALSSRQFVSNDRVQRAPEGGTGSSRAGRPRQREPMGRLRRRLDDVEPRSDSSSAGRSGFVRRRTRVGSDACVTCTPQAERVRRPGGEILAVFHALQGRTPSAPQLLRLDHQFDCALLACGGILAPHGLTYRIHLVRCMRFRVFVWPGEQSHLMQYRVLWSKNASLAQTGAMPVSQAARRHDAHLANPRAGVYHGDCQGYATAGPRGGCA